MTLQRALLPAVLRLRLKVDSPRLQTRADRSDGITNWKVNSLDQPISLTKTSFPCFQKVPLSLMVHVLLELPHRPPKPVSLRELANSIEKITGDDEILTKITLRYLRSLQIHLKNHHPLPDSFFTNILVHNWPYSSSPPPPEQFEASLTVIPPPTTSKALDRVESDYLTRIQKGVGRRIKGIELGTLCKALSARAFVYLPKKSLISKQRMLAWIVENEAALNEHFEVTLTDWISQQKPKEKEKEALEDDKGSATIGE
jgi:hypothetical protein